jgi:hypothetical protein
MPFFERILLYAVSITSIVLLFRADASPENPVSEPNASNQRDTLSLVVEPSEADSPVPGGSQRSRQASVEVAGNDSSPDTTKQSPNAIVLRDRRGQSRVEIKLNANDVPQILLNDNVGRAIVSLGVQENGSGRIALKHFGNRLEIGPDANGDLAVVLQGEQTEEIRLSLSSDGEAKLVTKGRSDSTVALSSRANGSADMQIHRGSGTGGPLMAIQKDGEAAIGIANNKREYGPVMHLFEDGLGQLTINGSDSNSGPTLIRTPDGTSIISVRHPNGQPAASMVGSPTGASILAVTNAKGTQQASLRSDESGKVDIGVTESKEDEVPKPKPQPQPPKVPKIIELIRYQPTPFPQGVKPSSTVAVAEPFILSSK